MCWALTFDADMSGFGSTPIRPVLVGDAWVRDVRARTEHERVDHDIEYHPNSRI
jgi:hypothetical protein